MQTYELEVVSRGSVTVNARKKRERERERESERARGRGGERRRRRSEKAPSEEGKNARLTFEASSVISAGVTTVL
jgi:hypothetical protein